MNLHIIIKSKINDNNVKYCMGWGLLHMDPYFDYPSVCWKQPKGIPFGTSRVI